MSEDDLFRVIAIGSVVISTVTIVAIIIIIPTFMARIDSEKTVAQVMARKFQVRNFIYLITFQILQSSEPVVLEPQCSLFGF